MRGTFDKWYAVLTTKENDWRQGTVKVSVQTASLNTGNSYRDADLRSDRFFDVQRYPKMTFEGSEFAVADSTLTVSGILTIKGRSKPITLTGQYRGIAKDSDGHERIAFEATGEVDRRDFGIQWNEKCGGEGSGRQHGSDHRRHRGGAGPGGCGSKPKRGVRKIRDAGPFWPTPGRDMR